MQKNIDLEITGLYYDTAKWFKKESNIKKISYDGERFYQFFVELSLTYLKNVMSFSEKGDSVKLIEDCPSRAVYIIRRDI